MKRFTIVQDITPGLKLVKDAAIWEIRRLKSRGKHMYQRMMRLWRNRIRTSWNRRPQSHRWHHPLWSGASSHLHKLELPLDRFPPKDRSCRRTPHCGGGCSALQPARIQQNRSCYFITIVYYATMLLILWTSLQTNDVQSSPCSPEKSEQVSRVEIRKSW